MKQYLGSLGREGMYLTRGILVAKQGGFRIVMNSLHLLSSRNGVSFCSLKPGCSVTCFDQCNSVESSHHIRKYDHPAGDRGPGG